LADGRAAGIQQRSATNLPWLFAAVSCPTISAQTLARVQSNRRIRVTKTRSEFANSTNTDVVRRSACNKHRRHPEELGAVRRASRRMGSGLGACGHPSRRLRDFVTLAPQMTVVFVASSRPHPAVCYDPRHEARGDADPAPQWRGGVIVADLPDAALRTSTCENGGSNEAGMRARPVGALVRLLCRADCAGMGRDRRAASRRQIRRDQQQYHLPRLLLACHPHRALSLRRCLRGAGGRAIHPRQRRR
jgi:hypothetical protein